MALSIGGRCEEAELAARVGMRRAATAESEAQTLRSTLALTQKEATDLGWQVGSVRVLQYDVV